MQKEIVKPRRAKNPRRWRIGLLFLLILLPLFELSACKFQQNDLPFETIAQDDWGNSGHAYEAQEPALAVIAQPAEVADLDGWITSDAQTQLQTLDYDAYFALIVFQGWKPSTGYSVQVNRITREENTVRVYAQFQEPKPDEAKADEATSPYHLVQVQKVGTWGEDVTFNLVVNGTAIVSASRNIP